MYEQIYSRGRAASGQGAPASQDGTRMREIRFDGRAAVVTGAGAGLGRCHALLLAARGAAVLVNDADPSRAESVAAEIVSVGGTALADSTDVATVAGGEKIIQTAADAFGKID